MIQLAGHTNVQFQWWYSRSGYYAIMHMCKVGVHICNYTYTKLLVHKYTYGIQRILVLGHENIHEIHLYMNTQL